MMMKSKFLLAALLLGSFSLNAGVVFEIETKDHDGGRTYDTSVSCEGKNLKMTIPNGGRDANSEMIYRGDRREMVVVDHNGKSYMVFNEKTMKSISGQVGNVMNQMDEALKNMPAERRAMIEKMMKDKMPKQAHKTARVKSQLKKQGKKARHNGYPSVRYDVIKEGRKTQELWVTDWKNIEGGADVMEAFKGMANFFSEMMDSLSQMGGGRFGGQMDGNIFEHFKDLDGFPVVTKEFNDDGSLDSESHLRSAERRDLDPADFEPPSGYKRRSMMPGQ